MDKTEINKPEVTETVSKPKVGLPAKVAAPYKEAMDALHDAEKKLLAYCERRGAEHKSSTRIKNCAKEVKAMIKVLSQYR